MKVFMQATLALVATLAVACDSTRPAPEEPPASASPRVVPAQDTSPKARVIREDELPAELQRFLHDQVEGIEPVVLPLPAPNAELLDLRSIPPGTEISLNIDSRSRRGVDHSVRIFDDGQFVINTARVAPFAPPDYYPPQNGEKGHHVEGRISKGELLEILNEMGRIGFLSMSSQDLVETCEDRATHKPRIAWTLKLGDITHSVFEDRKCNLGRLSEVQLALKVLEKKINDAVDLRAFIVELNEYFP